MPTYDYVCRECDHKWELFQSIKANPVRKCPSCGRLRAKRVIGTGAGIIFRGSGFYETDYRSDSYKKGAEADKKARESAKSDSTKKDSGTSGSSASDSSSSGTGSDASGSGSD
ncbi:MAG: zinc ribbon domain-containing protein [Planctomycetaceae bacterium]